MAADQIETLKLLLGRVKAAEGPTQELDAHIVCTIAAPQGSFVTYGPISGRYRVCVGETERGGDLIWDGWADWKQEEPTGSVDGALALVRHVLPGAMWATGCMEGGPFCRLVYPTGIDNGWGHTVSMEQEGGPATEPLAILSALLSAKLALLTQEEGR